MEIKVANSEKMAITNPDDVFELMQIIFKQQNMFDLKTKEHLWVIARNIQKKIVNIEFVAMGSINSVAVTPVEVFSFPITKQAQSIILVQNHPSGSLEPSDGDKHATDRMIQAGKLLNIEVADSMIITPTSYYSFLASGLLDMLASSTRYALTFVREREWKKKIEEKVRELERTKKQLKQQSYDKTKVEEKAKKEERMTFARNLIISNKMNLKEISTVTGLPYNWIARLKNEIEEQKYQENR